MITTTPIQETIVDFYGDPLVAVRHNDDIWVSIRRVCECLGIDRKTQQDKLQTKHWATGGRCPLLAADGIVREQSMISLKSLPMWLATVDSSRVAPEAREKLERYQTECHDVLAAYFFSNESTMPTQSGRRVRVDHTGTVIGNWTVTGPTDTQRWHIQCECGHQQTAMMHNIKIGCLCHACGRSSRHAEPTPTTTSTTDWPTALRKAADAIETLQQLNLTEMSTIKSLLS